MTIPADTIESPNIAGRGQCCAADVAPSAAALAANARLQEMRRVAGVGEKRPAVGLDRGQVSESAAPSCRPRPSAVEYAQIELEKRRAALGINYCRPALGQGVESAASLDGAADLDRSRRLPYVADPLAGVDVAAPITPFLAASVRIYPDLHIAAHAAGQDAAARVYLVCRLLDEAGRGWVTSADLRAVLEGRGLLTWRRVRQVLAQGDGVFWSRGTGQAGDVISPMRPGRILKALGGGRPTFQPVIVPAAAVLGSIADYRAACIYSAALAGRRKSAAPISQAAIREATGGLSERSQRNYKRRAGVVTRSNYRMVKSIATADEQDRLWQLSKGQRGRVAYVHHDRRGVLGAPGGRYIAITLPHAYTAGAAHAGRRGRLSKVRRDLPSSEMLGRGNEQRRRYCETEEAARMAWERARRPVEVLYPLANGQTGKVGRYWAGVGGV